MKNFLLSSLAIFALIGCGGGGGSGGDKDDDKGGEPVSKYPKSEKSITVKKSNEIDKIEKTSNSTLKLSVPKKKDIYLVITSRFDNQKIAIDSSNSAYTQNVDYKLTNTIKSDKILTPKNVLAFREKLQEKLHASEDAPLKRQIQSEKRVTNQYDVRQFYIDVFDIFGNEKTTIIDATARKVVRNVKTKYGYKTLVVWVEDDEYGRRVSQDMVDKLADTFLRHGSNNDLYDWVTNVYGKEWGSTGKANLIAETNYIDILIDDMGTDGIAGYFYAKDNFTTAAERYSNEKIMFYINSRVYSRDKYSYDENEKEVLTTLAHEFQHMIHFYQRYVLKDNPHPTWLNEMLSETTEDLVATKIRYKGPRNVDPDDGSAGPRGNKDGRYPVFNDNNTLSLTKWNNKLEDYGKVSAFGTFLTRNYNGAKVLHDIEYSKYSGYKAVEEATKENFKKLVAKWGAAVVLSDNTNTKVKIPRYNFGDFKNVKYNDITYNLGSINFFNYVPSPEFRKSATLDENANLYYHVGEVEGNVTINIDIPKGADISIISKEPK